MAEVGKKKKEIKHCLFGQVKVCFKKHLPEFSFSSIEVGP